MSHRSNQRSRETCASLSLAEASPSEDEYYYSEDEESDSIKAPRGGREPTQKILRKVPIAKPVSKRLSALEKAKIIDKFKNGIEDSNYSCLVGANGIFSVRKRANPLLRDAPMCDTAEEERIGGTVTTTTTRSHHMAKVRSEAQGEDDPKGPRTKSEAQEAPDNEQRTMRPVKDKAKEPPMEVHYFNVQNQLNDSLRKEIDLLHSKYDEIATKYSDKKVLKAKNKQKAKKAINDEEEGLTPLGEAQYEQQSEEAKPQRGAQHQQQRSARAQHVEADVRYVEPDYDNNNPPPVQYVPYVYRVNNWDRFFGY
jgi:hypothetical protein